MALPAWQATIATGGTTDGGNIIPSPVITVLIEATGLEATLFSDRAGLTPLGTLGVFTGTVEGFAQFYAEPGEYRITAEDSGSGFTKTWRYVVLSGTAAVADVQASPADATAGAVLNNETTSIGGSVNYTGANFQPDNAQGKNIPRLCRNNTGASIAIGATTGTATLVLATATAAGALVNGLLLSGDHENVSGVAVASNAFGLFRRFN